MGSGNAASISYLYVFFAQLFSYLVLGEVASLQVYIGSVVAVAGVYLVYSGEKRLVSSKGFCYALIAAVSWGFASTILKLASNFGDPIVIALLRNLFTVLLLFPIAGREALSVSRNKNVLFTAIITGALGLGVGMWLFIVALNQLGVSATVLATGLTPVLTRVLSTPIAKEKQSAYAYIGTLFTSIGILIGFYKF